MVTGNQKDLRTLRQMVAWTGIAILAIHCYIICYQVFASWGWSSALTDRFFRRLGRMDMFYGFHRARLIALIPILLSAAAGSGTADIRGIRPFFYTLLAAGGFFFGAPLLFYCDLSKGQTAVLYLLTTGLGAMLFNQAANLFLQKFWPGMGLVIFNDENESFPQEERLLADSDSTNFRTAYRLRGRIRKGWININTFRGFLLMGSPGSGKSCLIRDIIHQHIAKGYSTVVYDFKYDELTLLAYNCYLKYKGTFPVERRFCAIIFDDPARSHRCNPLESSLLLEIADAANAARAFLLSLNRDWVQNQGDFWNESAISLLTALIWYLKKIKGGIYCTLPHVMELLQVDYAALFSILRVEPDIQNHINPFISAYLNQIMKTLDNQISSLKIAINRLSSPALYYILTGNDITLDINNPLDPKILCLGNNPQRSGVYSPVFSLYASTINRLTNQKGKLKSSHIYDELGTIYIHQLQEVLATGRSNKMAFTLCVQNVEQLRLNYGRDQAEVIANLPGTVMTSQNTGDSARMVSEAIGRIVQERKSVHSSASDNTSVTEATSLEFAVPVSRVAGLSVGEFVGFVADNPMKPIPHKAFDARVLVSSVATDESGFEPLPVVRAVTSEEINANFIRVREEIEGLVSSELIRMLKTSAYADLVISKPVRRSE